MNLERRKFFFFVETTKFYSSVAINNNNNHIKLQNEVTLLNNTCSNVANCYPNECIKDSRNNNEVNHNHNNNNDENNNDYDENIVVSCDFLWGKKSVS